MDVTRVGDISHDEFMTRFYEPGIPCVFTTASKRWKARGLFAPDWFREHYGERVLRRGSETYTMRQVMDLVEASMAQQKLAEAETYVQRILTNHDAEIEEDLPPRTAEVLFRLRRTWTEQAS